jgi:DNA-binding response OmpR family regulator
MVGVKILAIDDESEILQLIKHILENPGYQVITALSGPAGLAAFREHDPVLVILDVMMPEMDGWEVCRRLRQESTVPIIILTALGWHEDVIKGLELGADDYVVKPFNAAELLARIEALLRRLQMPPPASSVASLHLDNKLVINPADRQVTVRGEVVKLTPIEYELILLLARHADRVLPSDVIFNSLWPLDTQVRLNKVKWYIWRLRQKIEYDPHHPRYILTEYGIGYRLAAS